MTRQRNLRKVPTLINPGHPCSKNEQGRPIKWLKFGCKFPLHGYSTWIGMTKINVMVVSRHSMSLPLMLNTNTDLFATWGSHWPKGVHHASRKRKASLDVREDGSDSLLRRDPGCDARHNSIDSRPWREIVNIDFLHLHRFTSNHEKCIAYWICWFASAQSQLSP